MKLASSVSVLLLAVVAAAFASACGRSLANPDALAGSADGQSDAPDAADGDHPLACFPQFHACAALEECCAPNRCINITGTLACQQENPALADAGSDDVASPRDAPACFPLFHACTSSAECCAPNLCINITGSPACQTEGPRGEGGPP